MRKKHCISYLGLHWDLCSWNGFKTDCHGSIWVFSSRMEYFWQPYCDFKFSGAFSSRCGRIVSSAIIQTGKYSTILPICIPYVKGCFFGFALLLFKSLGDLNQKTGVGKYLVKVGSISTVLKKLKMTWIF